MRVFSVGEVAHSVTLCFTEEGKSRLYELENEQCVG